MIYTHEIREKKARYAGPRPDFPREAAGLWGAFSVYLESRALNPELARINGWYPSRYRGAGRIVIPCSNLDGVPYFQARAMDDNPLRYASSAAPRDDSLVIVWPVAKAASKGCVVLEGPMCALAAADLGYVGIALMGNQPTDEVIAHLSAYARAFPPVIIVPDADALELGPNVLCALGQRGISGMILAPRKKDLGDMSPKERRAFLC